MFFLNQHHNILFFFSFVLGNLIKELPDGIFSGLQNLANLELHFNSITELTEKIFADLDNLRNLTIKVFFNIFKFFYN